MKVFRLTSQVRWPTCISTSSQLFIGRLFSSTPSVMANVEEGIAGTTANPAKRIKLTGRAFYQSIGSPKMIVAPMVDRSEFAWRLLTRSYLDEAQSKTLLAYSPMLHARLFKEQTQYRDAHFQPTKNSLTTTAKSDALPYLDGREDVDRPLFVQFCANKPEDFLEAAQYVAPYCDAVDLNLGCPQGIARSGHYGAFLQEDWTTIRNLIRKLHKDLEVPVTAKFRILETPEKTLEYARMILDAGASIITVHGRQRHQKGHNTGIADWKMIRYLRDNLPPETVIFANGNILINNDLAPCLEATGADGVMSAEGNLSDPTIFAQPPSEEQSREYWVDPHNHQKRGYRIDGVFRRYMDIIHRYVLEQEPPTRSPLYIPADTPRETANHDEPVIVNDANERSESTAGIKRTNEASQADNLVERVEYSKPSKKQKKKHNKSKDPAAVHNPNLKSMQGHLFQLLRPMLSSHTHIRDALARSRAGDIQAFENVLSMVEDAIRKGLDEEYASLSSSNESISVQEKQEPEQNSIENSPYVIDPDNSEAARERCSRPFWVCQPHIRPLPNEALQTGALQLSKKEKEALAARADVNNEDAKPDAKSQAAALVNDEEAGSVQQEQIRNELPREEALACG